MIKKQKRIRAFLLAGMMCFLSVQNVVAVAQESSNEILFLKENYSLLETI